MKPLILIACALSLTLALPASAKQNNRTRCQAGKLLAAAKFSQCRLRVEFVAEKKGDKFSAEAKVKAYGKCDDKFQQAHELLEGKYPATGSGGDDECAIYEDAGNVLEFLKAVGDAVTDGGASVDGANALATLDNADFCTATGGSYETEMDRCTVDITVDNAALCLDAGGVYAEGAMGMDGCAVDVTVDNAALCAGAGGVYSGGAVGLDGCAVDVTVDNPALCASAGGVYSGGEVGMDDCAVDVTVDNAALCAGAGGVYATGDVGTDGCFVDLTVDNGPVCEDGGGLWESGSCREIYNCSVGAMCSWAAALFPDQLSEYTNNYIAHLPGTGLAVDCSAEPWWEIYNGISWHDHFHIRLSEICAS